MTTQARDSPAELVRLLTVNEVANALGCGRTMVYELIDTGQLTRMKIGRLTRIPPAEVERFVRRSMGLEEPARRRSVARTQQQSDDMTLRLPL